MTGYDARRTLNLPRTEPALTYCHRHNLVRKDNVDAERRFGIRVTLPQTDTFARMLGDNWENIRWYATEEERDLAYQSMATRHGYYRNTDSPSQVLEKIAR